MPVERILLAQDGGHTLEDVRAPAHGPDWGVVHRSPDWRWILPGSGGVQLRSGADHLLVDQLTAFHLRSGEAYQLQHAHGRAHLVLSSAGPRPDPAPRAWLVDLPGLLALKVAARRLWEERAPGLAATAREALRRARALDGRAWPAGLLRARRLLAATAARCPSIEEVAEDAGTSAFQLARGFRRRIDLSPHQYRLRLRLALALQRLEEGERDLAGLAHDLGFVSQSHFGALLRRESGATPAQARAGLGASARI